MSFNPENVARETVQKLDVARTSRPQSLICFSSFGGRGRPRYKGKRQALYTHQVVTVDSAANAPRYYEPSVSCIDSEAHLSGNIQLDHTGLSLAIIHNERIELQRLAAERTFGQ